MCAYPDVRALSAFGLVCMCVILAGCDTKLEKLEKKFDLLDKSLMRLKSLRTDIYNEQASINAEAAGGAPVHEVKQATIASLQATLSGEMTVNSAIESQIITEVTHLNDFDFGELLTYIGKFFSGLIDKLNSIIQQLLQLKTSLQGLDSKKTSINQLLERLQQVRNQIVAAAPGQVSPDLIAQADDLLAQLNGINFDAEEQALESANNLLSSIQVLPIVANSSIPKLTVFLDDFISPLKEISDGTLAPGTTIDFFLPEGITLAGPATFDPKFTFLVEGNVAGSRHVSATITSGGNLNYNVSLTVQFNGINIGNLPCGSLLQDALSLIPGSTTSRQFLVTCQR